MRPGASGMAHESPRRSLCASAPISGCAGLKKKKNYNGGCFGRLGWRVFRATGAMPFVFSARRTPWRASRRPGPGLGPAREGTTRRPWLLCAPCKVGRPGRRVLRAAREGGAEGTAPGGPLGTESPPEPLAGQAGPRHGRVRRACLPPSSQALAGLLGGNGSSSGEFAERLARRDKVRLEGGGVPRFPAPARCRSIGPE